MPVATKTIAVTHNKDPKQVIWDAMNQLVVPYGGKQMKLLDCIYATAGDCVVCVYERPGDLGIMGLDGKPLITPDNNSRASEDKFQGVVGLIVKWGPDQNRWREQMGLEKMPPVGTWVAFRTGDTIPFTLGDRAMRLLQGNHIRMILQDPDVII